MRKKIKLFIICCVVGVASMHAMEAPDSSQDPRKRMQVALQEDNVETVRDLLDNQEVGLETILIPEHNSTPLLYAASIGAAKSGKLLLERNANKDATNRFGLGVVDLAVINNKVKFLKMLHSHDVDFNQEKNGLTHLKRGIVEDKAEAVDYLLECGVQRGPFTVESTNFPSYQSKYPILHYAVFQAARRVTRLLLEKYEYSVNDKMFYQAVDRQGRNLCKNTVMLTPNDFAVMNAHWKIAQLLKEHGADATSHWHYMTLYVASPNHEQ